MTRAAILPLLICLFFINNWAFGQINNFPYHQNFEENFENGSQTLFLPAWWGNEVGSNTRIFRNTELARTGAAALAAEPTSTFTADIRLFLNTEALPGAVLSFWARSGKNGTGTRPSHLQLSFSADGGTTFSSPTLVGSSNSFPNADSDYRQYMFSLPPELAQNSQAVIRWQISRSQEGAGTAAQIILDDVSVEAERARLQLLTVVPTSATELLLHFNMPVASASVEDLGQYVLTPSTAIVAAKLEPADARKLILTVAGLSAGAYSLRVQDLEPAVSGEPLAPTTIDFSYSSLPQFRDVVINEIFADPNPKGTVQPQPVVLPRAADAEFIELFNASAEPYSLQELQFNGNKLPSFELAPAGYVLLVPAGKEAFYSSWGPVLAVTGWRSLGNSGSSLQLIHTGSGVVLDSLTYSQRWYGEAGKHEGGWSLEQLNPYTSCSHAGNWRASTDPKGATPAAPNAVLDTTPDAKAPQLLHAVASDSQHIELLFDEYIAPSSLAHATVHLEPAITLAGLHHHGQKLRVQLEASMPENGNYSIYLQGLTDCSGNQLEALQPVIRPKPAEAGELIINEIMYDPLAGGAEWVELYNTSDNYLNLQNWYLGLREGKVKSSVRIGEELLLLAPKSYLLLTATPELLQEDFPETPATKVHTLSNMPNLRNSGDTLVLLDPAAQTAEIASYSDKLHHPLLRERKGVSLERIDATISSLNVANWTSAAFPPGGTPALPNSQQRTLEPVAGALRIDPEVVEPTPDGIADAAFIHYQMPQSGLSGTLLILDASGREIQRLASNQLLGQTGVFQWNGTNNQGERVRNGYYIVVLSAFGTDGFSHTWRKTMVVSSWH